MLFTTTEHIWFPKIKTGFRNSVGRAVLPYDEHYRKGRSAQLCGFDDVRFTYRIPEQENIWNAYRRISRRLLTIVDVPFKMDAEGRNVGAIPVDPKEMEGCAYTNPRNPTVAKLFRLADMAENVGFGLNTLRSWQSITGRKMDIERNLTATTVSFDLKSSLPNQPKSKVKSTDIIKGLMREEPSISLALKNFFKSGRLQKGCHAATCPEGLHVLRLAGRMHRAPVRSMILCSSNY